MGGGRARPACSKGPPGSSQSLGPSLSSPGSVPVCLRPEGPVPLQGARNTLGPRAPGRGRPDRLQQARSSWGNEAECPVLSSVQCPVAEPLSAHEHPPSGARGPLGGESGRLSGISGERRTCGFHPGQGECPGGGLEGTAPELCRGQGPCGPGGSRTVARRGDGGEAASDSGSRVSPSLPQTRADLTTGGGGRASEEQ